MAELGGDDELVFLVFYRKREQRLDHELLGLSCSSIKESDEVFDPVSIGDHAAILSTLCKDG